MNVTACPSRTADNALDIPTHTLTRSDDQTFTDPFLASWIAARWGNAVIRPLLLLRPNISLGCGPAQTDREDQILELINTAGGHAIRQRDGQISAIWGLQGISRQDPRNAIEAALAINNLLRRSEHTSHCLLHAKLVHVPNADLNDAEDAALMAFGGEAAVSSPSLPTLQISETFRSICGLSEGLRPINLPGDPTRGPGDANQQGIYTLCQSQRHDMPALATDATAAVSLAARLDRLGDLQPLLRAASIVGMPFTAETLGHLIDMAADRIKPALDHACTIRLLRQTGDGFEFRDTHLQNGAFETVPSGDRLRLHRKVAEILSRHAPVNDSIPEVARQHRLGHNARQSRRWFTKAAWRAIAQDNTTSAIQHLRNALAEDGDVAAAAAQRQALLQLLGVQLAQKNGNGADEVFEIYHRSVLTGRSTAVWGQEFRSLWLAQSCHVVKGDIRAALTVGNLLQFHLRSQSIERESALGMRILINRLQALTLMLAGQLEQSTKYYDEVLEDYDPRRHGLLRFAYGSDQAALAYAHKAWVFAITDQPEASRANAQLAREICDQLAHAHTSAHAMGILAIAARTLGDHDESLAAARIARAIGHERGFSYWIAWANVIIAANEGRRSPSIDYAKLEAAMASYRATGALQLCPAIHTLLSDAALRAGNADLALMQADAGLALVAQNACVLYRPELRRHRAKAMLAIDCQDLRGADATLDEGFREANEMGAHLFAKNISRDGAQFMRGQSQLKWQRRYHSLL